MCVGGTFPNSPTPNPEVRELGSGPDSSQALAPPQASGPPAHCGDGGCRGLCTIVMECWENQGFIFPTTTNAFLKMEPLAPPLLGLKSGSQAG